MQRSEPEGANAACVAVRNLVFEFIDRELESEQAAGVEKHLSACSPCAGFYAFERTFLGVLRRRVAIEQAPAELRERLRIALADRKRSDPPS